MAPTPSSINWPTSGGPIAGGYWADWNYEVLPVNEIDYDLYDIINYCKLNSRVPALDLAHSIFHCSLRRSDIRLRR